MPIEAAASSSSRDGLERHRGRMPRSSHRQTTSPPSQTTSAIDVEGRLVGNCSAYQEWPSAFWRHAERAAGDVARGDDRQQHDLAQRQRHQREIVADDLAAGSTDSR